MTSTAAFNPWPWFAAAVLAAVVVANVGLILAARHARPTLVEDRPWLASAGWDAAKAARSRFAAAGCRLQLADAGEHRLRCAVTPAGIGAAMITLYRPDDRDLDQRVAWADSSAPATIALPRGGLWRVRVDSCDGAQSAEATVELQP